MAAEDAERHAAQELENVKKGLENIKSELDKAKEDKKKGEDNIAELRKPMTKNQFLLKQIRFHYFGPCQREPRCQVS